jgi:hypothetical protein
MNNRKDTAPALQMSYRLATKTINNSFYSRLDFPAATMSPRTMAVVSDENESVIVDTETDTIQKRVPVVAMVDSPLKIIGKQNIYGRINVSIIKSEAKRLSLDMKEEPDSKLLLNIPVSMIKCAPHETVKSSRVVFDTKNELLVEVETVRLHEDGSTTTITSTPAYEMVHGEPVKIGSITVIDTKIPTLVDGFEKNLKIYNSADDIPILDAKDAQKMIDSGHLFRSTGVVFGNPADLSKKETVVELYKDIKINETPDSAFKLVLGGKK